jgi:hypothetical protein
MIECGLHYLNVILHYLNTDFQYLNADLHYKCYNAIMLFELPKAVVFYSDSCSTVTTVATVKL